MIKKRLVDDLEVRRQRKIRMMLYGGKNMNGLQINNISEWEIAKRRVSVGETWTRGVGIRTPKDGPGG